MGTKEEYIKKLKKHKKKSKKLAKKIKSLYKKKMNVDEGIVHLEFCIKKKFHEPTEEEKQQQKKCANALQIMAEFRQLKEKIKKGEITWEDVSNSEK